MPDIPQPDGGGVTRLVVRLQYDATGDVNCSGGRSADLNEDVEDKDVDMGGS